MPAWIRRRGRRTAMRWCGISSPRSTSGVSTWPTASTAVVSRPSRVRVWSSREERIRTGALRRQAGTVSRAHPPTGPGGFTDTAGSVHGEAIAALVEAEVTAKGEQAHPTRNPRRHGSLPWGTSRRSCTTAVVARSRNHRPCASGSACASMPTTDLAATSRDGRRFGPAGQGPHGGQRADGTLGRPSWAFSTPAVQRSWIVRVGGRVQVQHVSARLSARHVRIAS